MCICVYVCLLYLYLYLYLYLASEASVSYATSTPMALTMSLGDSKSLPAFSEQTLGKLNTMYSIVWTNIANQESQRVLL